MLRSVTSNNFVRLLKKKEFCNENIVGSIVEYSKVN